ncbi:hypothetical protein [Paenibacillus gansuensis]|uniref:Uncharacterized protein n=1 Tax=Paenibacillus gansuensis TaxID=306542 RepID=A0ABW5PBD5_9BACL
MLNSIQLHPTGEMVLESGTYISENGVKYDLARGDKFPACPADGSNTTWRPQDHLHQTGDLVTETGVYVCNAGERAEFEKGNYFPVCPVTGEGTQWKHV